MITAVTTCMGRRDHLEATLPLMLEEFDRVIVVDWSCPQYSGEWAAKQGAEVVFETNKRFFNICKARNAGARHVQSRSVCFIDADTLIIPGLKFEIEEKLNLSTMVLASRSTLNKDNTSLCGFLALDIGHFWGVGGYNEKLEGYALEDCHIRAKLCLERGLSSARVTRLAAMRHADGLRGAHYAEHIDVSAKRNRELLHQYLQSHGVIDWVTDPRTAEIAYRE